MLDMMCPKTWDQFQSVTVRCPPPRISLQQMQRDYLVSVKNFSLYRVAPYDVSDVHIKFQSCTVHEKVVTTIYNNPRADLVVCAHK